MKEQVRQTVRKALESCYADGTLASGQLPAIVIEKPAHAEHGDFATNAAMLLAKAEKKAPVKRKSRSKTAEPERRKLFWGVFNQSAKRVALFDFSQRKAAEAKAGELTASGKNQHFVMKVKEAISG
jgi:arginyl-tRNA synthetase